MVTENAATRITDVIFNKEFIINNIHYLIQYSNKKHRALNLPKFK